MLFVSDMYFKTIIVTVTLSVFATVVVINLACRSVVPVPTWMEWLVLNKMSHIVWFNRFVKLARKDIAVKRQDSKEKINGHTWDPIRFQHLSFNPTILSNAVYKETYGGDLNNLTIKCCNCVNKMEGVFNRDWKLVAEVVSRFFALIFSTIVTVSTVTILVYVWYQSEIELENSLGHLKDEWQAETYFTDE